MTKRIAVRSKGNCDIVDITAPTAEAVRQSGIGNGMVTLFLTGSTAALSTIEYEPGLVQDFKEMWERLVPRSIPYQHDRAWGDGNGHSHVRASLLGPSLSIPFSESRLLLGTWQQVVLVDFDNRPRSREIVLQVMGE
ncbi:MAG: secondary thiamine-phosphate synthase enzyme YjbQ [Chloroflexota bacterium]